MPANSVDKKTDLNTFVHIYNKGVEGIKIFKDDEDYDTFVNYLQEYLSSPPDPNTVKQQFTVNGRTYHGTPHMPKNYYNKVELVAYSLMPNHFHLVLHQLSKEAQIKFLRSLGTRYSMYYNKKYNRRGSLFAGSYKSAELNNATLLPNLVRYIYTHNSSNDISEHSSYSEYISKRDTDWIKSQYVLSQQSDFKKYVTGSNSEDLNKIKDIIFDGSSNKSSVLAPKEANVVENKTLEGSNLSSNRSSHLGNRKIRATSFSMAALGTFVVLFTVGFRNVQLSSAEAGIAETTPEPQVAAAVDINPKPTPQPSMVVITIQDSAKSVNIRQLPTTDSEILQKAEEGEEFVYIDEGDNWYHLNLGDGKDAYVSKRYANLQKGEQK